MNNKITARLGKIKEVVEKPYPFVDSGWKSAVVVGFCIFLFLYIFQPLGLNQFPGNKFLYTLGFGFITVVCLLFDYWLLNLILKQVKILWTVWCEIIWDIFFLSTIALGNGIYNSAVGFFFFKQDNLQPLQLLNAFLVTFPVGILFVIVFALIKNARLKAQQKEETVDCNPAETSDPDFISISSANKKDPDVVLSVGNILYIESMGNLLKIHYLSDGTNVATRVIRNTLKNLAALEHPDLYRCHRSFVLNLHKINQVSGNSNGYMVKLIHVEDEIPVSRKYAADFIRLHNSE
ncbi:MAG: LytTR family transcriptional regulator [Tannerellaceae bacterium]|nr:LytTR family transcriptional regulator [Tannerellaceae bacterium]